ncbi:hypothetical protein JCM15519_19330 [Fundidesulfovibrio butyratiphilus]
MPFTRLTVVLSCCVLAMLFWVSWFLRYDLRVIDNQEGYAVAYRLDRWTGDLRLLDNDRWYPVTEGDPIDFQQSFQSKESSF